MKIRLTLHKNVQEEIMRRFSGQNIAMEVHFKAIRRIADLYWHEKKIVFEIQCSPITLNEVINRTNDYNSIGIKVIWLLHDKTFNRTILSKAERYLRGLGALYTNIDGLNKGSIYDQTDTILYRTRIKKGPPIPINIKSHNALEKRNQQSDNKKKESLKQMYVNFLTKIYHKI